jgi:hypothetical protein
VALGVRDPRVEAAFAAVAREDFLGPGPWQIHLGCMAGEPVDAQNNMTGASFRGQERVVECRRGFGSILKTGLRRSEDFREGVEAFGAKRKPSCRGR